MVHEPGHDPAQSGGAHSLNNNLVTGVVQDDKGLIWIATDHGGINLLDKKDFSIRYLLAREDELELSLVPASVQKTVKGQIGNGELVRIARATNEDGVRFEIEARKNGKSLEFSVNPAGKILENEN